MATPVKTAVGTWRVQIEVKGVRDSNTLPTKRDAVAWAAARRAELVVLGSGRAGTIYTLGQALRKYAEEVSPTRRGERNEVVRLAAFQRGDFGLPVKKLLADVTTADLAKWRDARLGIVARGSVLRDMGLLSAVLTRARLEWGWIEVNPLTNVRRPANPDHRAVLITGPQIRGVLRALGHRGHAPVRSVSQAVATCFLAALGTGMRAGELCGLTWAHVHDDHVYLPMTKNGKPRAVPVSKTARRIIERMRGFDDVLVFGIKSQSLDALFRRARGRAGLEGFTFHDARHTAATRMARLVDVLDLCKIFGWSNTSQALTYYNETPSKIALRLR